MEQGWTSRVHIAYDRRSKEQEGEHTYVDQQFADHVDPVDSGRFSALAAWAAPEWHQWYWTAC